MARKTNETPGDADATTAAPASSSPPIDIPIDQLPTAVGLDEAVQIACDEDLDWIEERLRGRMSVLVECDKQLSLYLFKQLRTRLKQARDGQSFEFVIVDGRPRPSEEAEAGPQQDRGLVQQTLTNLKRSVFNFEMTKLLCIPHLDLVTTTTRSGLTVETREVAALLYENPNLAMLAFKDPSFELPSVIESVFPFHRRVSGIPRRRLPQLITQAEARKFATGTFNPYELYKYVSGLNVIRLRQVLSHFLRERDYDPLTPGMREERVRMLRDLTVTGEFELPDIRLDRDIAGYTSVKKRLREEILDLLDARDKINTPAEIEALEKLIPRGIIFEGPPGTGKTLFAKGLATEMNATVIVVSGPEIKSKWLGETEANLRGIFTRARRAAPSIIVFEEIDSIAPSRDSFMVHEVSHSTVNQLLTEMDGFRSDELVFIVGTTNFVASLDPALLRPGRFELKILVDNPHDLDRKDIIRLYRDRLALDMDDNAVEYLVRRTRGYADRRAGHHFTGDHIFAIAKAIKREVLRRGKGQPVKVDVELMDTVLRTWRGERKKPNTDELKVIAAHEAGHTLLNELLPEHPPTEKVTLEGDDDLGDMIAQFFAQSRTRLNDFVLTEGELRDMICATLGGRLAEELLFPSVSVGAANDFEQASHVAQLMVMVFGMAPLVGGPALPVPSDDGAGRQMMLRSLQQLLDPRVQQHKQVAPETLARVDAAVEEILQTEYKRGRALLEPNLDILRQIADRLFDKKELTRADIADLLPESSNQKAAEYDRRKKEHEDREAAADGERKRRTVS
ncbi:MAG: AAA family ATPase [Planctomycetota bacterium]